MERDKLSHQIVAPISGNTKPSMRARSFQLTLNEIENWEALKKYLTSSKLLTYIIACQEVAPTTNHKHIHCYVHFSQSKSLSIKKCVGAHIEICRGTVSQNIDYIKKDGNIIFEFGEVPKNNFALSIAELKEIKNPDELDWKQYNTWIRIQNEPQKIKIEDWHKQIEVIWIQGPSGIGKSKLAISILKSKSISEFDDVKFKNGFWLNTSGTGSCIYDDFRDSHLPASEFINFIDYNIHNLNMKGKSILNCYELIIITSIQNLDCIYSNLDDEPKQQWMRRIKVIDLYGATLASAP